MNRHRPIARRLTAVLLAGALSAAVLLTGCTDGKIKAVGNGYKKGDMMKLAQQAQADMYQNYWSEALGRIANTPQGYVATGGRQSTVWDHGMMIFEMYSLWMATGDDNIKTRITAEWNFLKTNFSVNELTSNFGNAPNIAIDDTGWAAMTYIDCYKVTGDMYALQVTKALIQNGYAFYKDGDTANGLWYLADSATNPADSYKSGSDVGIVSAALEYQILTGDDSLYADTLNVYNWMEQNLCRDAVKPYPAGQSNGDDFTVNTVDNLYWIDYNVNRTGRQEMNGPDGGLRPMDIKEAGSVSCLFVNMGMGVIQARLYQITKDTTYRDLALRTVEAVNNTSSPYNNNGVYVNDRDAWADGTFMGAWVSEVLTLSGIQQRDYNLVFNTAQSIGQNCRTADGYWRAEWSGGNKWVAAWGTGGSYKQIMAAGSTVCMITGAAWLEKILFK
ncbi:MAG: hypothetical protein FWF49_02760 [Oscillospiraceae bacterium]|nr:hypothetical protein [Oscillospiraceae bacterium]